MNFGFSMGKRSEEGRKDWKRYYDASVVAGETEFQQLAEAARKAEAYISLGFSDYISPNTNDNPEWQATIQHIAIEGKCFFVNADMIIRRSSYPSDLCEKNIVSDLREFVCRGGSCIIDPYGHYLTKPVWDEETIIYAELDMSLPAACKMEHDAIGHYARPDILELKVNEK